MPTRNRGNRTEQTRRYIKKHYVKVTAHRRLSEAIQQGKVERHSKCSVCGGCDNIMAHHEDYDKPLEVIWLCWICHNNVHNLLKESV